MKIFVQLVLIQLLFDYLDYNFLCHIFAWNKISIKKKFAKIVWLFLGLGLMINNIILLETVFLQPFI